MTIAQKDNYARKAKAHLPLLRIEGMKKPVLRIFDGTGTLVYAYRLTNEEVKPHVFAPGLYTVEIGEPGTERLWRRRLSTENKRELKKRK